MASYKAAILSREYIREFVHSFRKELGRENELYFPIITLVESILPILIPDYNFEIGTEEEMGNRHGDTIPSMKTIRIREDVYLRAVAGVGYDRFTIAHEVGHLLFHDNDSISLCRLAPFERLAPYEDPEWQANAFAGELLAPSYLIKGMTAFQVARKCGISTTAANFLLSKIR